MPEIVYEKNNCEICEEHKTERGLLQVIKRTVEEDFKEYTDEDRMQLIIALFVQWKLDLRTEMIQGFKQKNIKAINK